MIRHYLARRVLVPELLEPLPLEFWPASVRGCSACLRNEVPLVYLERRDDPALCGDCLKEMLKFLKGHDAS